MSPERMAAFAARRLVLFGSQPAFVLDEAVPGQPARLDLYVLLLHPLTGDFYDEIISQVMLLSKKLVADPCVQ